MHKFYENLFKKRENVEIDETSFKNIVKKLPKLNNKDKTDMEKEITLEELKNTITNS